jgi:deazaflavin-dependent oxidoreductase (nitroreductase family)
MLLKLLMSPLGYKFDRWMVRWTGDSPLSRVFARGGGYKPRMPLLLVAKGRKSGKDRMTVLAYFEIDGKLLVVGSAGGSPSEPQWVANLRAHPEATFYIHRKPRRVTARFTAGEEYRTLWDRLVADVPTYAGFQAAIQREIPLVVLD